MNLFKQKSKNNEAFKILNKNLGGSENIISINHCATRLRIVLKDPQLVNLEEIEKLEFHNGVLLKGDVIQLLIPKDIESFNKEYLTSLGISVNRVANLFDVELKPKKGGLKAFINGIGVIVTPIVPFLITLGIVATITNVIKLIDENNPVYEMFAILQNALVLGFSILIPWSIFKMMNGRQAIGISLGIVLCAKDLSSTLLFMQSGNDLFKWTGTDFSFSNLVSGYPWKISFEGQILPLVGIGFMGVYLERLVNKIKWGVIKQLIGIPAVTIITFFVALLVIAPIGMLITYGMNIGVLWATTHQVAKYVFNPIFGLILPWTVVTGFIQIFVVINLQQFAAYNATTMMALFTQLNIAVATSTLAVALIHSKNKELQKTATPSYLIAFASGSTEPALFGFSLRFLYPVIAASIGSAVGAVITTSTGVLAILGTSSLLIFLSVIPQANVPDYANFGITTLSGGGFLWMAVALVATIGTTFLATMLLSRVNYFKSLSKSILEKDFSPILKTD
ncbi:PTS system trehalose-specific IIBC component [Spiroplasma clarkii]|uniref:PTS system, trehalose-specific IIB component n=1 Tax=Spiroplasma clarkii TaxID=2139 RepID=A0A1Y0L0T2_9MOLU|nr:PTS transporter subunit EIIB [Spiroplasma clarkii]ARU91632.1 PTS system trehalose-specific IIBC component [Spiroplasma clarkii]ATX71028.1 PTS system, trehalose-specific IIB component [Spiroplasma clarkii]